MTKIEHYRNSFISVISNENKVLWCDPWLNDANGGFWAPSEISIENFLNNYNLPNLIYLSHIHEDHFDLEFIKSIFKKKEFKIIIPKGDKSYETMYRRLISISIPAENILRLCFYKKANIDNFDLVILPQYNHSTSRDNLSSLIDYDIDSSLLINVDSIQIFNQNDNFYNSENIQFIRKKLYSQDIEFRPNLSFIPYCSASCYPQSFLDVDRLYLRKDLLKRIFNDCFLQPAKTLNSGIYIPSGGTYSLCDSYKFIDIYKAVPSQFELSELANQQNQVSRNSIFIGNQTNSENYELRMLNLKSDIHKKSEIMQNQELVSLESYKVSFIQASKKLDKFINQLPLTLFIYLISYKQLEISLKSGVSSDIDKFEMIYKKNNSNTQNKLKIFLTPFCLKELINEAVSWNAINFGAVFVREPNIYFPSVDMFLSLFFKVTSNCFLSESHKN